MILPPRTSPTAKIPGKLVSSKYGGRVRGQPAAAKSSGKRSGPVFMKPLSSSAIQPYIFDDSESNEKSEPRYVIESRSNKKKIVTKGKLIISNKSGVEKIRKSVAALRLFKKGAVGFPFILSTKTLDIPIPIEEQRINISDMPNLTSDKKYYHITNNEVSKFKQFWKEIERIKYNRHLELAMARFNLAYQRVSRR